VLHDRACQCRWTTARLIKQKLDQKLEIWNDKSVRTTRGWGY